MTEISTVAFVFIIIGCILAGLIAGFFLSRWYFKRELAKNPPINEKQIRAMLMQMGQQPSEKKIRQIMKAMEQNR